MGKIFLTHSLALMLCLVSLPTLGELNTSKFFLKGRATKDIPLYTIWEPIEFVLEMDFGDAEVPDGYTIAWTCNGDDGRERKGTAPAGEAVRIQTVLDRPGFIRVQAKLLDAEGREVRKPGLQGDYSRVFFDGGAGVDELAGVFGNTFHYGVSHAHKVICLEIVKALSEDGITGSCRLLKYGICI